eukprot:CAMPEP_0196773430 /NCGR_PEP_ID=MMETSP1104-20130614/2759_1 /TAXON_ID=33652 /ORGANISM="Cafeteria sp., Strain Caron Lab Isolate" /LENGTH=338 /DNA_ID=CAMNT_0042143577 /DNA_START=8 /DNA_END=1021 /DNA_ORIENTATION=+
MDKKARSKPMQAILAMLPAREFVIVPFGNDVILNKPVEEWPVVDALLAFFSSGFPLNKAERYVALREPLLINDVTTQRILLDRRKVYRLLEENGIPVPRHVVVERDTAYAKDVGEEAELGLDLGDGSEQRPARLEPNDEGVITDGVLEEHDDYIVVGGQRLNKPLVEKPVDGEDHNIYIYYPRSMGGGSKRLFRKVGNLSSTFHAEEHHVRRDASYIYEEFLHTQGTDIKVYSVGPNYAHAEARKSPVVDGRVMRDKSGKEIRYPILLSAMEKQIAWKVCMAFQQTICGFDLLRTTTGQSFVCDVNGLSFVKSSAKYYRDTARILRVGLLRALAPEFL